MGNRILHKVEKLLKEGISPRQLAWSFTLAFLIGIFPIMGTCNIIITLVALRFKLNLALMILISYLVYPVQILLFVPFIRLGEWVFRVKHSGLTWEILSAGFEQDVWETFLGFGTSLLYASAGWLLVSLATVWLLYTLSLPLMKKIYSRIGPNLTQ